LITSDPANFLTSPFVPVRGTQSMFTEGVAHPYPSTERSQTGSGSSPSTDFLSQVITSLNPGPRTPQESFDTTAPQRISTTSPSQSPLHPLAPRWPLSTTDSAYVF
jgi:hypothetical protein